MTVQLMSPLEIFIGTWNTTGEVLETEKSPATILLATDTYRWFPGKHFIIHDVDARFGGEPIRSMEVIGYDSSSQKHTARSYDDNGVSETFEVALDDRDWVIVGKSVRFNGLFDLTGNQLTGLWELKSEKVGWQPWIKLKLIRA
ncbi:MAG TPA: DUF1579 family protein [Cellvibrio sp.]|nr:DUF1579 family protein [Cellvibrio sp.]